MQEETTSMLEEEVIESMPENGVQRIMDVIVEQRNEEDASTLHLQLEDSEDANIQEMNMDQNEEMEQDIEEIVSDLCNIFSHFC